MRFLFYCCITALLISCQSDDKDNSKTDTDGDGISDTEEITNKTDKNDPCDPKQGVGYKGYDQKNTIWIAADCDDDGITNGEEVTNGTDPYKNVASIDTDGDGISDEEEIKSKTDKNDPCDPKQGPGYKGYDKTNSIWLAADCDTDGMTNGDEVNNGTDPYKNVTSTDTDGDGISDTEETKNKTDKKDPCDPKQVAGYKGYDISNTIWLAADCDSDGIKNGDEVSMGTDPYKNVTSIDTDGDGISNTDEIKNKTDKNNPCDPKQVAGYKGFDKSNSIWLAADCDDDGVKNGAELTNGTDPYHKVIDNSDDFLTVLLQPIVLKNSKNETAFHKLNKKVINNTYSKAKVKFVFLKPKFYENDNMYYGEISDLEQMVKTLTNENVLVGDKLVVNLIISKNLAGIKPPLGRGLAPGNITFMALLEDENKIENSFNVSHEVGHNFGLKHAVDDPNVDNNSPNIMANGTYEQRLDPKNSLNDYQIDIVKEASITHTSEKAKELISLYSLEVDE